MRCKNCGWENPVTNAKCEKCNLPLSGSSNDVQLLEDLSSSNMQLKNTAKSCSKCGYPVRNVEKSCPQCGFAFEDEIQKPLEEKQATPSEVLKPVSEKTLDVQEPDVKTFESSPFDNTMMPWLQVEKIPTCECSLKFVSRDGQPTADPSLRFAGNPIQLNRGNTEPSNQTITSKIQAELSFENGKWYIQDKSVLKTTYIYAKGKIELQSGDIIAMGNRLFEFKYNQENAPESSI